jgi:imidazolonepropionase-like amidohydrolase
VCESIKAGVDLIKFTAAGACTEPQADTSLAELSPESLAAGVGAAKALGRPSACHAQGTLGLGNAVRAGVTSIEHGFTMTEEMIAEMIERRTYLVPTLCVLVRSSPISRVRRTWSREYSNGVTCTGRP